MKHYDVVISGCGPVGAVLANLLAASGLSVCIVERFREVYDKPRAIVVDWEAMRALQFCGVADALFPGTKPHPGTNFVGLQGQTIKLFDPAPQPYVLGWPPTLTFVQPELERLLRARLEQRTTVRTIYGRTLGDFSDTNGKVIADIADPETGAVEQVSGDFLVGCDGANSAIRAALGFGLEDYGFDQWWVVLDAWQRRETDLPVKSVQYCWPSRPGTYVIGPGDLRRWELKLLAHETPEDFEDPAYLEAALSPFVDTSALEIWRSATYRFAARVGDQWRKGRVLLAGDAVHQTPPFLGQGLCAGIRDALNLSWKLVQMQRHGLNEALLDSYQAERKPHVGTLIAHAKEFGLIIGEMDEAKAKVRDAVLGAELASGKMVTSRQDHVPDLEAGLIGTGRMAGALSAQPRILTDGGSRLLDDLLAPEFLFLTSDPAALRWLDECREAWSRIGGIERAIVAGAAGNTDVRVLREDGTIFADWQSGNGFTSVLVRPDRYVYATVRSRADLAAQVQHLAGVLTGAA
ncbi:MAG: bifunctional 3-(3-hydroxy-phenyl)propionate/3-hydroxycinnamic acid hydroxylase [Rhodobacteraceae bacterium]|nr:bifunctional 3-(3-hydroxy-phenyl)propionate/3-hydroxycinnamic acid hydroxylase [Paracoccaceae bacterium]